MIGMPNRCCILELRANQCFVCHLLSVPRCIGEIDKPNVLVVVYIFCRNRHTFSTSLFISIDTESINFDHHLRCGAWLNFELAKGKNIRDGPLKLFTRS